MNYFQLISYKYSQAESILISLSRYFVNQFPGWYLTSYVPSRTILYLGAYSLLIWPEGMIENKQQSHLIPAANHCWSAQEVADNSILQDTIIRKHDKRPTITASGLSTDSDSYYVPLQRNIWI